MGKNNRSRRAAKAKRRANERARGDTRSARQSRTDESAHSTDPLSTAEFITGLLGLAVGAIQDHESEIVDAAVEHLCALAPTAVFRESERHVLLDVGAAWSGGWQPSELARQVRRVANAAAVRLSLFAIAADHARRPTSSLDARWIAQLDDLDLPPLAAGDHWIASWAGEVELTWPEQVHAVVALLGGLAPISPIAILIPPPGAGPTHDAMIDLTSRGNDPMLNRVRALLAQAESTNFEAEAETFTAKAQELMTRHAIDLAMVSASAQRAERPDTIRIPIDDHYVEAKSLLLQFVAESSRCRAVFHPRFAMSSVVGFASDLAATEMLFTSLLVQAQVAMQAAATSAPPGARTRSRSFRAAFLTAYAHRVAERLAEINAYVVADKEAETGGSILPVLAARSSVVDSEVAEMFGRLRSTAVRRGHDPAGWASGRMAADRARLNGGDLSQSIPASADPVESI